MVSRESLSFFVTALDTRSLEQVQKCGHILDVQSCDKCCEWQDMHKDWNLSDVIFFLSQNYYGHVQTVPVLLTPLSVWSFEVPKNLKILLKLQTYSHFISSLKICLFSSMPETSVNFSPI